MSLSLTAGLLLAMGPLVAAQGRTYDARRIAPNQQELRLTERSPLSALAEQTKRIGWDEATRKDPRASYELSKETFQLYLPRSYRKTRTYGLVVWVAPGFRGVIPPFWERTLDRRKLIAVGADRMGNDRHYVARVGMTLDAAHNLTRQHRIDPKRVYVMGFSGGGDIASFVAYHYPEVFQGAIILAGGLFYRRVPIPSKPGMFWLGGIPQPPTAERLRLIRERSRFVYLCGEKDRFMPNISSMFALTQGVERFKHSLFVKVPKLAHRLPEPSVLARCLRYLDKPWKKKKKKDPKKKQPPKK